MFSRSHRGLTATVTLVQLSMTLAVLLCPLGRALAQEESQTQSPARVLQDLLARYGDNDTITVPQLRSLLARLSQGQGDSGGSNGTAITERPPTTLPKTNSSKVRKQCSHTMGSQFKQLG